MFAGVTAFYAAVAAGAAHLLIRVSPSTPAILQIMLSAASIPIITALLGWALVAYNRRIAPPGMTEAESGAAIFPAMMALGFSILMAVLVGLPVAHYVVKSLRH